MGDIQSLLEIGGGYGYLMKDFLIRNPSMTRPWWTFRPASQEFKTNPEGLHADYVIAD